MSVRVLDQLTSEEFAISTAFLSTATTLRRFLARSTQVADVKAALRQGSLTEEASRRFVTSLLLEFRPGERFQHELAIAALAVALEQRGDDFAEEFLKDLSRLKRHEMNLCSLVAKECLKHRKSMARDCGKVFDLRGDTDLTPFSVGPDSGGTCGSAIGSVRESFVLG